MLTAHQSGRARRRLPRMSVDRAVVLDGDTKRLLGLDSLEDLADFLNLLPARRGRVHISLREHLNHAIFVGI